MEFRGVSFSNTAVYDARDNSLLFGLAPDDLYGSVDHSFDQCHFHPNIITPSGTPTQYRLGPDGSFIPVIEAPSIQVLNRNPTFIVLPNPDPEEDDCDKLKIPYQLQDHIYAKKRKLPDMPVKSARKRSNTKKSSTTTKNEPPATVPEVDFIADASNTKVNIIRKNVQSTVTRSTLLRPKILQNSKRVVGTPAADDTDKTGISSFTLASDSQAQGMQEAEATSSTPIYVAYQQSNSEISSTPDSESNAGEQGQDMCFILPNYSGLSMISPSYKTDSSEIQLTALDAFSGEQQYSNEIQGEVAVFSLSQDNLSLIPQTIQTVNEIQLQVSKH